MKLFGPARFIHVGIVPWQFPQVFVLLLLLLVHFHFKQNIKYRLPPFQNLKYFNAVAQMIYQIPIQFCISLIEI